MIPPTIAPTATKATSRFRNAIRRKAATSIQSATNRELKQKSEQAAAEDDVHNIPFPSPDSEKSHDPYNSGEPVERLVLGSQNMHSEPHGQVHHDTHNRGGDRGERGG